MGGFDFFTEVMNWLKVDLGIDSKSIQTLTPNRFIIQQGNKNPVVLSLDSRSSLITLAPKTSREENFIFRYPPEKDRLQIRIISDLSRIPDIASPTRRGVTDLELVRFQRLLGSAVIELKEEGLPNATDSA